MHPEDLLSNPPQTTAKFLHKYLATVDAEVSIGPSINHSRFLVFTSEDWYACIGIYLYRHIGLQKLSAGNGCQILQMI